jgi:hypothetical protein
MARAAGSRLLADGGFVFVADERTADRFEAPASDLEQFLYGAASSTASPSAWSGTAPRAPER